MSQYVSTEDMELVQVATNLGWSDFCEWAGRTEMEDYPTLHHLVTFGFANDPRDLLHEIGEALDASPPSPDVEDTAAGLMDFLRGRRDAEIVVIGNGMTDDSVAGDDEEGEGEEEEDSGAESSTPS